MNRSRSGALLVLALSACAPTPRANPSDELKEQELGIVMRVTIQETSQLKAGQWALYSVRSAGSTASYSTRLAVVAVDAGHYWIENRTSTPGPTGTPRVTVLKYQIDASAKPLQVWYAEGGSRPVKIYPGKDAAGNPIEPIRPPAQDPSAKIDIAKETITLHHTGKTYDCTRLSSKATYANGKETSMTTWCSPEVPFPAVHNGTSYGGVVRRTYGNYTLELDVKGTDAVAELALPEK